MPKSKPNKAYLTACPCGDVFLWYYYGVTRLIFRSRIDALMKFVRKLQLKPRMILDVGCGPMFVSYTMVSNAANEYIGVDVISAKKLKRYKDALRNVGIKAIEAVRSSAESLPFQNGIFDFCLSLDVLEHLSKPREGAMEVYRVARNGSLVAISLPLENLFERLLRIGFFWFMKITGDPFVKGKRTPSITQAPKNEHFIGDIKSYDGMVEMLEGLFNSLYTGYTPLGFLKSINVCAVHIFQRK